MKDFPVRRVVSMLAMLCLAGLLLATEDPLVIETKQGRVHGKRIGKADVFLGIPYAEPPVGELRWRPPVEKKPWQGVREATSYALPAPQRIPNPSGVRQASEDCLYLNVFTPVKRGAGARLPVMVFLHGGSNVQGNPNMWTSGTEDLFVGQRDNVVLVTPQFRLGVIGFLAHPALTAESEHHSSGNYGFLDQIAALRWVHENIDRFGGDPNRVTVFGSSSGSIDTGALVASPLARGLFHRAIMQSWPMAAPRLADRERHQGLVLAEEALVSGAKDVAAALRALPWQKLVEIQVAVGKKGRGAGQAFNPTVDGWALSDTPLDAVRAGKHNHVPFMIGAQSQDARAWVSRPIRTKADFQSAVNDLAGRHASGGDMEDLVKRLNELYPVDQYESPFWAYVDLLNDSIHTCADRRIALAMAANQDEPVYWYVFSQALSGEYAKYGADHPLIDTYLFQLIRIGKVPPWYRPKREYAPTKEDLELADTLLDYWISFAANGHLRGASSTEWFPVTDGRDTTQIIRIPVESRSGYKSEQCACWDDLAQRSHRED
jgi:para-nitrobenzyl esterase